MINTRPLVKSRVSLCFSPNKTFHENANIPRGKKLEWKACNISSFLILYSAIVWHDFVLIFSGIKNSSRNISFLNINRKCPTNSWSQRTTRPIVKIKLFGSRREGTLGGGHKYRPIKSYPLPRVTSRRVRATKMLCPLLSSFHPLVFSPASAPAKCLLAPFIPNQIPDPLVWRRFRSPRD